LRFVNPTAGPIYINETDGTPYSVAQGTTTFSGPHDCTATCSSGCQCAQCGAPLPLVRRIPAGESYDTIWSGDYWERITCGGDPSCACDDQHWAALASYDVSLAGALAYTEWGGSGNPTDPNLLQGDLDPSAGTCTASKSVALSLSAATVEIPFACAVP
jgi:hypothetical protein